jgi:hypothetical protein
MNNFPISVSISTRESFNKKIPAAAIAAVVFILCSLPQVYNKTDTRYANTFSEGCPTPEGKFIHAALFFAINYFLMKVGSNNGYFGLENKSNGVIAKYAFYATLLFFVLASTDAYRMTGKFFSGLANEAGCPDVKGVIVHGIIFLVVLILIMYFPMECEVIGDAPNARMIR